MKGDVGIPVRFRFTKRGKVRFISHRDVARAFDRAIRVVRLPVAFTEGFSPRPKMSFGLALPVAAESDAEYLDIAFADPIDPGVVARDLSGVLPEGMDVTGAAALDERAPALQESVSGVEFRLEIVDDEWRPVVPEVLREAVTDLMGRDVVPVVRVRKGRKREGDLRPAVLRMEVADEPPVAVVVELTTGAGSARPGEVTAELGPGWQAGRVRRTKQWIERDGARLEPLDADTHARAEKACAS